MTRSSHSTVGHSTARSRDDRLVRNTGAALVALWLAVGCQAPGFKAERLPPEYRVGAKTSQSTLNLSRMAGSGLGNSQISPGDLLEVTITTGRQGENPQPMLARVAGDGTIDIPLIGSVAVAQLEPFEASQNIVVAGTERGIYRRPHVTVDVKTRATNKITVLGAVKEPGTYEIPRSASDLAAAIGAAGGLTEEASRQVDVLRQSATFLADSAGPTPAVTGSNDKSGVQLAAYQQLRQPNAAATQPQQMRRIDLAAAPGIADDERRLSDRDVVMVLPREKEMLYVAGLVNSPGQFELPHDQDVHLLDALALGGGLSSPVADRVLVIRRLPNQPEPIAIRASLSRAKKSGAENIRLAAGDTVSVERTPATVFVDTFKQLFRMSFGLTSRSVLF